MPDPTLRGKVNQVDILTSIVERLIDQIDELNENTCWLSDQPIPLTMPGGRYAVTVSMGAGRYMGELFGGGGHDTTGEDGSVVITPLVVSPADRVRRKWKKIAAAENIGDVPSILYFKTEILKAMLGDGWEPQTVDRFLCRSMISPLSCDAPRDVRVGETMATASQIVFSTVFDWDLT